MKYIKFAIRMSKKTKIKTTDTVGSQLLFYNLKITPHQLKFENFVVCLGGVYLFSSNPASPISFLYSLENTYFLYLPFPLCHS